MYITSFPYLPEPTVLCRCRELYSPSKHDKDFLLVVMGVISKWAKPSPLPNQGWYQVAAAGLLETILGLHGALFTYT